MKWVMYAVPPFDDTAIARAFGHGSLMRATTLRSSPSSTASLVPWQVITTPPPPGMGAAPYGLQPKPRLTCCRPPRSAWLSRDTVSLFWSAVETYGPASASVRGYRPTPLSLVSVPCCMALNSRRATVLESGLTTKTWPSGATPSGLDRVGCAAAAPAIVTSDMASITIEL